jgi:MFS family permease
VAVIAALAVMHTGDLRRGVPLAREPGQIRAGFRYAWHTPALRIPLVMMAVVSTLAYNYSVVLPLLTGQVYGRGGGGLGALSAAMGVGALAGALLMASRARPSRRLLVASTFAFGVVTVALAAAPSYYVGMALLVLLGAAGVLFISTTNSLLQLNADDAMRGRVMSLWAVLFLGSTPVGGPLTGLLARGFGVRWAVAVGGVAALATAAGAYWALRRRQLRAGACEVPVCLPDGPASGDALTESVAVHTAGAPDDADGAADLTYY